MAAKMAAKVCDVFMMMIVKASRFYSKDLSIVRGFDDRLYGCFLTTTILFHVKLPIDKIPTRRLPIEYLCQQRGLKNGFKSRS